MEDGLGFTLVVFIVIGIFAFLPQIITGISIAIAVVFGVIGFITAITLFVLGFRQLHNLKVADEMFNWYIKIFLEALVFSFASYIILSLVNVTSIPGNFLYGYLTNFNTTSTVVCLAYLYILIRNLNEISFHHNLAKSHQDKKSRILEEENRLRELELKRQRDNEAKLIADAEYALNLRISEEENKRHEIALKQSIEDRIAYDKQVVDFRNWIEVFDLSVSSGLNNIFQELYTLISLKLIIINNETDGTLNLLEIIECYRFNRFWDYYRKAQAIVELSYLHINEIQSINSYKSIVYKNAYFMTLIHILEQFEKYQKENQLEIKKKLFLEDILRLGNHSFILYFSYELGYPVEKILADKVQLFNYLDSPFVRLSINNNTKRLELVAAQKDELPYMIDLNVIINSMKNLTESSTIRPIIIQLAEYIFLNKFDQIYLNIELISHKFYNNDSHLELQYLLTDNVDGNKVLDFLEPALVLLRKKISNKFYNPETHTITIKIQLKELKTSDMLNKFDDIIGSEIKPLTVPIGIKIGDGSIKSLDYNPELIAHTLIVGSSGSGKSDFTRNFAYQTMRENDPNHVKIIIIDTLTFNTYYQFLNNAIADNQKVTNPFLLCPIVDKHDLILPVLERIIREVELRKQKIQEADAIDIFDYNQKCTIKLPVWFVIIEEFKKIMNDLSPRDKDSFVKYLTEINRGARNFGIKMVYISQSVADLNLVVNQCSYRICLNMNQKSDYANVIDSKITNFYPKDKHIAYVELDGQLEEIATATISKDKNIAVHMSRNLYASKIHLLRKEGRNYTDINLFINSGI